MTLEEFYKATENMPKNAEILIKVDMFTFEPASNVGVNKELNEIVIC